MASRRATRVRCNRGYHVQSHYEEENNGSAAHLAIMEFALCNVTQSVCPFYRINYLALYSILSFIRAAVLTPPASTIRGCYSRASFSPSFVFASGMTHRRIIFAARVRLLISSHAFLRTRPLSSFCLSLSPLTFIRVFSFPSLFFFFVAFFRRSPVRPWSHAIKSKDTRIAVAPVAFVARSRTIRFSGGDKCYWTSQRKKIRRRADSQTASANCCNNVAGNELPAYYKNFQRASLRMSEILGKMNSNVKLGRAAWNGTRQNLIWKRLERFLSTGHSTLCKLYSIFNF